LYCVWPFQTIATGKEGFARHSQENHKDFTKLERTPSTSSLTDYNGVNDGVNMANRAATE
jgi:hypothetical protein